MASSEEIIRPANRIIFLDKIRYTIVIGVVILHAACAYARIIPWWSVRDPRQGPFFDLLIVVLDIFSMPILFFIAGFFTPSSLAKRASGRFITAKLKRLGIPLVLVGIFLTPVISFIGYRNRTEVPLSFLRFWWMQIQTIADWRWINYGDPGTAMLHVNDFSLWHLWFISLLLIMFLVTALFYKLFPAWFRRRETDRITIGRSVFPGFLTGAIISMAGFALINRTCPDWAWGKIGGVILIQPTRISTYLALFVLGIYANTRGWFTAHAFPGKAPVWLTACLTFSIALMASLGSMDLYAVPTPWRQAGAHAVLRALAVFSCLGFFITAVQQRGNRPTRVWRNLHRVSYDIYILHLPLVVVCQAVLLPLPMAAFAKFAVAGLGSLAVVWVLGRYVVEPYPVRASGLLLTGFVLCASFLVG
jgi:glucans biosynthesis protein C